jgi:hypothetical protein
MTRSHDGLDWTIVQRPGSRLFVRKPRPCLRLGKGVFFVYLAFLSTATSLGNPLRLGATALTKAVPSAFAVDVSHSGSARLTRSVTAHDHSWRDDVVPRLGAIDDDIRRKGALTIWGQREPLEVILRRVRGEYIEMPGLRLTVTQAQRLWGLDRAACDTVLSALVDVKFLFRNRDGAYMLRS